MKIDIWSDIACPYCYVGSENFENALKQFEHRDKVEVVMHSFELESNIGINTGESQHEAVMRKYHQSAQEAQQTLDMATLAAKNAGVTIDFDKVITTNTFDAHRLMKFAASEGKGSEIKNTLYKAYFSDGNHIGDKAQLIQLATDAGLDAEVILKSDAFSKEVRQDEMLAHSIGVRSVPYYKFNGEHFITGARPVTIFLQILNKLWEEEKILSVSKEDPGAECHDGACTI